MVADYHIFNMVYNDETNGQGIVQEIDFQASTNSTTYPLADKTRSVNNALDRVVSLILGSDGRWQWDDTNNTDLPIGVADLVSGQKDYSFQSDYLVITRIEAKDSNGNWQALTPFDQNDLNTATFNNLSSNKVGGVYQDRQSLTDFLNTNGNPLYYDKLGNSIFVYPSPNYNSTGGLKAYFQRTANYFTSSDTTKTPGFAPHLHKYLALSAAFDYAVAKGLDIQNRIKNEMQEYEQKIMDFYSYRPRDEQVIIRPHIENYR